MRKSAFGSVSASTLLLGIFAVTQTDAAELPLKMSTKAPAATQAAFDWTGCYLGVQAGGGMQNDSFGGQNGGGALAGGQVGCNYQVGRIIVGVEGEAAWSGLKDRASDFSFPVTHAADNRWNADLAARAGVAIDRALIYGKVGVAQGGFAFAEADTSGNSQNASGTLTGLLLGGGIEYAFAPNWSARLEYDHIDYVARPLLVNLVENGVPLSNETSQSVSANLVKAGINYRFGSAAFAPTADWQSRSPIYKAPSAAAFDWTGCYVGVQGGGGTQNDTFTSGGGDRFNGGGGLVGGQVGCNYQSGAMVFGLEGEAAWSNLNDKLENTALQTGFFGEQTAHNRWIADVAARGGVAIDRALIYGKAGVAEGGFAAPAENTNGLFQSTNGTLTGLLVGAGIEYAFAPNWSARLEFDHIDYVSRLFHISGSVSGTPISFDSSEAASANLIKTGINYRFGGADRPWVAIAPRVWPASSYNWSGCYGGVQAGGGVQNDSFTAVPEGGANGGGGLAGGQLGCNIQTGQIVFGVEGEAAWSGLNDTTFTTVTGSPQDASGRNRWTADVAARAGVAVDRALIYGKIGVARGDFAFFISDSFGNAQTGSGTSTGLLLGAGLEYAFAPNWSAKFEYDHIDYGARLLSFNQLFDGAVTSTFNKTESASADVAKLGVNYHFNSGNLVTAKY